MFAGIAEWFASKAGAAVKTGLAIIAVPLLVCTVWQTVQIYGVDVNLPIVGKVQLATGLQSQVKSEKAKAKKASNVATKTADACTAATNKLKLASDQALADQKAKTVAAQTALASAQAAETAANTKLTEYLNAAKPTDERPLGPYALQYLDSLR